MYICWALSIDSDNPKRGSALCATIHGLPAHSADFADPGGRKAWIGAISWESQRFDNRGSQERMPCAVASTNAVHAVATLGPSALRCT